MGSNPHLRFGLRAPFLLGHVLVDHLVDRDALDRFGTRLEKRYSKEQVRLLLEGGGLEKVTFSDGPPWWVAVGWRRSDCK